LKSKSTVVEGFEFSYCVSCILKCIHQMEIILSNNWYFPGSVEVDSAVGLVKEFSDVGDPLIGCPRNGMCVFKDWESNTQVHLVCFNCYVNGIAKGCLCLQVFEDLKLSVGLVLNGVDGNQFHCRKLGHR